MSRLWRLFIIVLIPTLIIAIITAHIFQIPKAISNASVQAFRATRYHASHAMQGAQWDGLKHLGLARHPQIGKCTVAHGEHNDGYKQALQTHLDHSEFHGYPTYVLDRVILDGLWTKEAALLEMMLEALSAPKGERLRWIFWFDADTVVMNKFVPLEAFIPPDDRVDVHLLYTKDWNGLNNGVFMLKVTEWSVALLSSIVAYRTFKPEEDLPFTEQSAMEKVLQLDQYKDGAVACPPQWFNAYPNDGGEKDVHFDFQPGQLLVHFAGIGDKSKAIGEWVEKLEGNRTAFETPLSQTNYEQQISEFWTGLEMERTKGKKPEEKKPEEKKPEEKKPEEKKPGER